jgi:hypothetical protein
MRHTARLLHQLVLALPMQQHLLAADRTQLQRVPRPFLAAAMLADTLIGLA